MLQVELCKKEIILNDKIYHLVKCPGSPIQRCRYKVQLEITEKDYGKKVRTKCPECEVEFTVTLVRPIKPDENPIDGFLGGLKWPFE